MRQFAPASQGLRNLTDALRTRLLPLVISHRTRDPAQNLPVEQLARPPVPGGKIEEQGVKNAAPPHYWEAVSEASLEVLRRRRKDHLRYGITHTGEQAQAERARAANPDPLDLARQAFRRQHDLGDATEPPTAFGVKTWLLAVLAVVLQAPQFPLWALGEYLGNGRPRYLEFASSVRFAVVAGGTFLVYPLALLLLPWPGKIWLMVSLLTVRWSLRKWEDLQRFRQARRYAMLHPDTPKISGVTKA